MGEPVTVGYGCCVGSWDKLHRYVTPRAGSSPLLGLSGQTSIAVAYNAILDAYRSHDLDALVLLHDDLEITDRDFVAKLLAALSDPDVALVGVAGGRGCTSLAWWEAETVGHQATDSGPIDFGQRSGDVQLLEGSLLGFSPWAIAHLRFDTAYVGFHGYDEIAMQVLAAGKRVVVIDADTYHHTPIGWRTTDRHQAWLRANDRFRAKWAAALTPALSGRSL